jgi:monovalent cation/hydrogen antiporter
VAHALVVGLPWGAAWALGAIVSPTDPLAGSLIMRRLKAPRVMISAIEGEGLFNDATALVCYRVAVAAVVSGSFSIVNAGLRLVIGAVGGVAIGLAVGWLIAEVRKRTTDPEANVTMSLLAGYAAFIPANTVGASGVLAAVTAGIYMGQRGPTIMGARTRLLGSSVWEILDSIINGSLFTLVGLQLHAIVDELGAVPAQKLVGYAVVVSAVVIATRIVWFYTVAYLIRLIDRRPAQRLRRAGARPRFLLAWSGTRGAVSLAAALALPLAAQAGRAFPDRDLIIFLTFAVIFATLVIQGLSLPSLIRRLGVTRDGSEDDEEILARLEAVKAALAELDELDDEEWTREDTIERMRAQYDYRRRRFAAQAGKIEDDGYEERTLAYQHVVQAVLAAQRQRLLEMRDQGEISNETMNRVIRELDLEESRLEI